jgi:hypothetical protein
VATGDLRRCSSPVFAAARKIGSDIHH